MEPRRRSAGVSFAVLASAGLFACRSEPQISPEMLAAPARTTRVASQHSGPPVSAGHGGPARFARTLYDAFDSARAFETVQFIDRFYRAPGNDGYEAVLAHIEAQLRAAGFGAKTGFELEFLEADVTAKRWPDGQRGTAPAWTPLAASLALVAPSGTRVLQSFDASSDRARTMLPVNSPACDVEGPAAFSLDALAPGSILVTDQEPSASVLSRAHERGAKAVLSCSLASYNVDPSGKERHRDAIQYRQVFAGAPIPLMMISPRTYDALRAGCEAEAGAKLALKSDVRFDSRKLRTLVARVVGADRPNEAVAVASHVQEPGACDNASGVAGLCESACNLLAAIESGKMERPSRTLVFLWGDEFRQSSTWLAATKLVPIAGLSSDMTGESREKTGAFALLERMPDPAACVPLPPDEHTPWGKAEVDAATLKPNGVALVARTALVDVGVLDRGWQTAEHPYEGGSDHDEFIKAGVPAALFWHFTDFAYHTSLDRTEMVDPSEMRRTGAALLATACALADPEPEDLERYLRSLDEEHELRLAAAADADDEETAQRWNEWCAATRQWLRVECLRIPPEKR